MRNNGTPRASAAIIRTALKPSPVFDSYWRFAAERQSIFFKRLEGLPGPWTSDPILAQHKFTNAYRAADRVSQFLIREVIYRSEQVPEEIFFRTLLFKLFNKIETWQLLERALGGIRFAEYCFDRYDAVLGTALANQQRIYSAAYMMASGHRDFPVQRKHQAHLLLLERMMKDRLPARVADAKSMQEVYTLLRGYPMIGNFLAYQYATDLNYSTLTDFSEMEFTVPGPGALDGIRKCFVSYAGWTEADIIRYMAERQEIEFAQRGITFQALWGRPLQLIDAQNLFCEVDKYARVKHPDIAGVSGRMKIKQKFKPIAQPIPFWFPPKWGINESMEATLNHLGQPTPTLS